MTLRLLALGEQLPGVNISDLVSRWPYIVLEFDVPALTARMQLMRWALWWHGAGHRPHTSCTMHATDGVLQPA